MPRSRAICAIGRSPSSASRTARWISSSGYFFGRAMATERLLPRGQNPRFEVSAKPGPAQSPRWDVLDHRPSPFCANAYQAPPNPSKTTRSHPPYRPTPAARSTRQLRSARSPSSSSLSVLPTSLSPPPVRPLFSTALSPLRLSTNCYLCRALTPPEHLIVFGRGQG